MNYEHFKYDETIMQSKTVNNIIEAIKLCIGDKDKLEDVAYFLIIKHKKAMKLGDGRKTNSGRKKEE